MSEIYPGDALLRELSDNNHGTSTNNSTNNNANTSNNRNNNNTDTDQILAKKEFQHILQKYGKREDRRRKLFKAFSQDVRQLSKTTDSLLDAEQETMTIPDIDCNFSDLNQTLDSLKSSYEEHLISLCSQWILKEVKVQLLVIDSVSKIVKKNTSSVTAPVEDEKAVDGQEIHQEDADLCPESHSTPRQSLSEPGQSSEETRQDEAGPSIVRDEQYYSVEDVREITREFVRDQDMQIRFENFLDGISAGSGRVSRRLVDVVLEETDMLTRSY